MQRPLATVVIGGLVTSTLLTLVVLPSLYVWWFGGEGALHRDHYSLKTQEGQIVMGIKIARTRNAAAAVCWAGSQ